MLGGRDLEGTRDDEWYPGYRDDAIPLEEVDLVFPTRADSVVERYIPVGVVCQGGLVQDVPVAFAIAAPLACRWHGEEKCSHSEDDRFEDEYGGHSCFGRLSLDGELSDVWKIVFWSR